MGSGPWVGWLRVPQHQGQPLWVGGPEPSEKRSTAMKLESWREPQGTMLCCRVQEGGPGECPGSVSDRGNSGGLLSVNQDGLIRGAGLTVLTGSSGHFCRVVGFGLTLIKPGPILLLPSLGESILFSLDGYGSPERDAEPQPLPCYSSPGWPGPGTAHGYAWWTPEPP